MIHAFGFSRFCSRVLPVLVCMLVFHALSGTARAQLEVRSAILMNLKTGQILYEQNVDEPIPPASLTKILTMYMALERVKAGEISLNTPVSVSRAAARTGGSRMALVPREKVALEDLLLGMAVSSGNDASAAVAEFLGGSQQQFVELMNARAVSLGMGSSIFRNPHGLPAAGQTTTARDMLTLSARYLQACPEALRYHSTRFIRHNGVVTYNKNPLLGNYEGADGLKTGWVNASGYNLVSTARRGDTRLLAVVMGAENSKLRAREIHRLMEAGFAASGAPTRTVAEILPTLAPEAHNLSLDKTIYEAYATLAPGTLKAQPKSKGKSVKKAQARTSKKNIATGKNTKRDAPRKARKQSRDDVRQASLGQRKG